MKPAKKPHPADLAELAKIEEAHYFAVAFFIGSGRFDKSEYRTLALARNAGRTMAAQLARALARPASGPSIPSLSTVR